MALYEVVREIENECSRNQMRDVFFREIETDDPIGAVREMLKADREVEITMEVVDEDNCTVWTNSSGMIQRFLFTKI